MSLLDRMDRSRIRALAARAGIDELLPELGKLVRG
jgi:hypothetical protein